jgi:hypothetical protein
MEDAALGTSDKETNILGGDSLPHTMDELG